MLYSDPGSPVIYTRTGGLLERDILKAGLDFRADPHHLAPTPRLI